jgi:multidrug efflux pump
MTSLAFGLGVVPLVLAKGAGAEMRYTLGVAVLSGMMGVTIFGIFFTPVFYYVIRWLSSRKTTGAGAAPPARHGEAAAVAETNRDVFTAAPTDGHPEHV